jgi:hypothetical protein
MIGSERQLLADARDRRIGATRDRSAGLFDIGSAILLFEQFGVEEGVRQRQLNAFMQAEEGLQLQALDA